MVTQSNIHPARALRKNYAKDLLIKAEDVAQEYGAK